MNPLPDSGRKPKNIRDGNLRLMLTLFRKKGILSILEASQLSGLSKTTVNKLVTALLAQNKLLSIGKGPSTEEGGKKPELFTFNSSYAYSLCLTVLPSAIRGSLFDLGCNLIAEQAVETGDFLTYKEAVDICADLCAALLRKSGLKAEQVCGVALGCDGVVNAESGTLLSSSRKSWGTSLAIGEDLRQRLPFSTTVYVDTLFRFLGYMDASMADNAPGKVITLYADTFAGGAVVDAQGLVHGPNGYVGEFGHMPLEPDSFSICSCGGRGCFEALVRPDNILSYAQIIADDHPDSPLHTPAKSGQLDMHRLFAAANEGDSLAQAALTKACGYFATLIQGLTLLHDPDEVILEGLYSNAGDFFLTTLNETLDALPFYKAPRATGITYSHLTFASDAHVPQNVALGAALYVADDYLNRRLAAESAI
ncbi:ROK family protein [Ruminococcaceae bacterium OttesenSCG-928-L11]|nr:ROK family protein [Ruminococcaceae bacterium OttesenSCG-928-L11]